MTPVTVERGLVFTTAGETTLEAGSLPCAPDRCAARALRARWRLAQRRQGGCRRRTAGALAAHGVTVAPVDYRLVPGATFPDQVHDLKGAVRWLRAYGPSLGVRTDRLGIWGASAGAYLGSLVALTAGDASSKAPSAATSNSPATSRPSSIGSGSPTCSPPAPAANRGPPASVRLRSRTARRQLRRQAADRAGNPASSPGFRRCTPVSDRARRPRPHRCSVRGQPCKRAQPSGREHQFLLLGGAGHEGPEFERPAHLTR